jgi:hypothetical protein
VIISLKIEIFKVFKLEFEMGGFDKILRKKESAPPTAK